MVPEIVLPPETPISQALPSFAMAGHRVVVQSGRRRLGQITAADVEGLLAFGLHDATIADIMLPLDAATAAARSGDAAVRLRRAQPVRMLRWSELQARLGAARTQLLRMLTDIAEQQGVTLFLVGGVVRTLLSPDERLKDLDIAVAGNFDAYLTAVVHQLAADITQQSPFMTATVALPAVTAALYDITAFDLVGIRSEDYEHIGALPVVQPVSHITDDLHRRDLTINAMAIELLPAADLPLYDPYDGRIDLADKRAVFLHPISLFQDPTRLVRLARLVVRLGLTIPPETKRQIAYALAQGVLFRVSHQRWLAEWQRCLDEPQAYEIFVRLQAWGIRLLLPGMLKARQNWFAAAAYLPSAHRFAVVVWHIPENFLAKLLPEWPELPGYAVSILALRQQRFAYARWLRTPAAALVARLAALHPEALPIVAALEPTFAAVVARYDMLIRHGIMYVTGADLIAAGYQPGPDFGRFLAALQRRIYADVELSPRLLATKEAQAAVVLQALADGDTAFVA